MMAFILTNTILMLTDTLLTTDGVLAKKMTKSMQNQANLTFFFAQSTVEYT